MGLQVGGGRGVGWRQSGPQSDRLGNTEIHLAYSSRLRKRRGNTPAEFQVKDGPFTAKRETPRYLRSRGCRESKHTFLGMGPGVELIRTEKPGEPRGAPAGGVISRAVSEAGSGSGGKNKKIPLNWKQLLLLGPSAAIRGRSVATVKIRNGQQ